MTLSDTVIVAGISGATALLTTIIATWVQREKWREGDRAKTQADAADAFAGAAAKSADTNSRLIDEIDEGRKSLAALLLRVNALETELKEVKTENENLRRQVVSMTRRITELEAENSAYKKQLNAKI